jgi:hypothetical protein
MWGLYLVAFVLFVIGAGIFFGERGPDIDADDIGRSHSDEKFSGLVLMTAAALLVMVMK